MKLPFVTRQRAQSAVDITAAALRHQLAEARAEAAAERRHRRRAEDHARALAAQLDEVTAANQSYDKEAAS